MNKQPSYRRRATIVIIRAPVAVCRPVRGGQVRLLASTDTAAGFSAVSPIHLHPLAAGVAGHNTRVPRSLSGQGARHQVFRH